MKIKIDVPDGKSGDWEVSTFTVTRKDADMFNLRQSIHCRDRHIVEGKYKKLKRKDIVVMSNTPAEIADHYSFSNEAKRRGGDVLINGLGIGVALKMVSEYVDSVTVIELSDDVISLCAPTYQNDPKIKIINADAFKWKPPKGKRYTCVWHDIWDNIEYEKNLPEMKKLHRKYGRRCDWQGSWCRAECEYQKNKDEKETLLLQNLGKRISGWTE